MTAGLPRSPQAGGFVYGRLAGLSRVSFFTTPRTWKKRTPAGAHRLPKIGSRAINESGAG
jgi:hypothetical protein